MVNVKLPSFVRTLLIAVLLVAAVGGFYGLYGYLKTYTDTAEEPIFCTMDVKVCSDGSYVGRIPPRCEFAVCPKEDLIR